MDAGERSWGRAGVWWVVAVLMIFSKNEQLTNNCNVIYKFYNIFKNTSKYNIIMVIIRMID